MMLTTRMMIMVMTTMDMKTMMMMMVVVALPRTAKPGFLTMMLVGDADDMCFPYILSVAPVFSDHLPLLLIPPSPSSSSFVFTLDAIHLSFPLHRSKQFPLDVPPSREVNTTFRMVRAHPTARNRSCF